VVKGSNPLRPVFPTKKHPTSDCDRGSRQKDVKLKVYRMKKIDVLSAKLVPKHTVLSREDAKEVLSKYEIDHNQLPKILAKDPVVKALNAKVGDIIKIERVSDTAGTSVAYRRVID
jgi:DNA-directed RNA polymerase subunit H